MKQLAINFCSILPRLFSDELDRMSMWDRIANGITVGVKRSGGDVEIFANTVLEYIKANAAMMAACDPLAGLLCELEQLDEAERRDFLRIIDQKKNVIIVHARNQWKDQKGGVK